MTRRRVFAALWLAWIAAFVAIEGAALLACGDFGPDGCTLSAVIWRVSANPAVWWMLALALVVLGVHLLSRGRF